MKPLVSKQCEILRAPVRLVTEFKSEPLKALKSELLEAMKAHGGIGIAAPQLGINLAAAIVKLDGYSVMILNPQIVDTNRWYINQEGCLSLPGRKFLVPRPEEIKFTYQNSRGEYFERVVIDKYESAIIHHEISHIQGLLLDDVSRVVDPLDAYKRNRPSMEFEQIKCQADFKYQLSLLQQFKELTQRKSKHRLTPPPKSKPNSFIL